MIIAPYALTKASYACRTVPRQSTAKAPAAQSSVWIASSQNAGASWRLPSGIRSAAALLLRPHGQLERIPLGARTSLQPQDGYRPIQMNQRLLPETGLDALNDWVWVIAFSEVLIASLLG